jgi:hypothetical protein
MTTCSRCPSPARWRDPDGRQFCGSHVPTNGKPLARLPAPEIDIVELLRGVAREEEDDEKAAIINNGVFEIRRLRAELDKSTA